jgi:hypothetical protein
MTAGNPIPKGSPVTVSNEGKAVGTQAWSPGRSELYMAPANEPVFPINDTLPWPWQRVSGSDQIEIKFKPLHGAEELREFLTTRTLPITDAEVFADYVKTEHKLPQGVEDWKGFNVEAVAYKLTTGHYKTSFYIFKDGSAYCKGKVYEPYEFDFVVGEQRYERIEEER